MSLLARVARLERDAPPPPKPDGCPECADRTLWIADPDDMDKSDWRLLCPACGRPPPQALKVLGLPRSVEAAL